MKREMGHTSSAKYVVLFCKSRSQWSHSVLVLYGVTWSAVAKH